MNDPVAPMYGTLGAQDADGPHTEDVEAYSPAAVTCVRQTKPELPAVEWR